MEEKGVDSTVMNRASGPSFGVCLRWSLAAFVVLEAVTGGLSAQRRTTDVQLSGKVILAGGQGVVSVTANVAPEAMASMCRAALAGDAAGAEQLDKPLAALHRDLFVESNPIPVKWALARMGLIDAGIRLPLIALSAANQPAVEAALHSAGLLPE